MVCIYHQCWFTRTSTLLLHCDALSPDLRWRQYTMLMSAGWLFANSMSWRLAGDDFTGNLSRRPPSKQVRWDWSAAKLFLPPATQMSDVISLPPVCCRFCHARTSSKEMVVMSVPLSLAVFPRLILKKVSIFQSTYSELCSQFMALEKKMVTTCVLQAFFFSMLEKLRTKKGFQSISI